MVSARATFYIKCNGVWDKVDIAVSPYCKQQKEDLQRIHLYRLVLMIIMRKLFPLVKGVVICTIVSRKLVTGVMAQW